MNKVKSDELLKSFFLFCQENPHQRFWQALRNWSGQNFVFVGRNRDMVEGDLKDTYYWEGKNG